MTRSARSARLHLHAIRDRIDGLRGLGEDQATVAFQPIPLFGAEHERRCARGCAPSGNALLQARPQAWSRTRARQKDCDVAVVAAGARVAQCGHEHLRLGEHLSGDIDRIDAGRAPWEQRRRLWAWLGGDWKPDFDKPRPHVHMIGLDQLMDHTARQLEGEASGRVLVEFPR